MPGRPRRKGYPLKQAIWSRLHWHKWDAISPSERLAYEQFIEENDNNKVAARIRGHVSNWSGKRISDAQEAMR